MRATITALMENGKIDAGELDFLREVAAQAPFVLTIPGSPGGLSVPPVSDDAVGLARLLISPPNMHTLWHGDAEKTGQLVEISRWGPLARQRVANFFGSKLYDAWGQSNLLNAFSPFVDSLGREWNAVKTLSDPAAVRAGKELLIEGCEAYAEDRMAALVSDGVRIRIVKPCARCVITTTDQSTAERDGEEPLRTLKTYRWDAALKGVVFAQNAVVEEGAGAELCVGMDFRVEWR
jgi:hypothetical protein